MVNEVNDVEATRFRALLDPIRDLAASWGIDVAKELTDYAESLGIDLCGDGALDSDTELPTVPVDFAEAALLVQGSTSIYSRKVEHLYGLVYKAVAEMNLLRGKTKSSGNGTFEPGDKDPDADELLDVDKVNFLSLETTTVNMADEKAITLPETELPPAGSLSDPTTLKPIPRMLRRGMTDENNLERSNFKMLTATTHSSGALIMEGCPPITEDLEILPQLDRAKENERCAEDDNDRDDDFGGFPNDDDDGFATPPPMPSGPVDSEEVLVGIASSAKKRREPRLVQIETKKRPKPKKDPFLMLDPHEPIPSLEKPLRVGKTYRRPRKLQTNDTDRQDQLLFDEKLDPDLDLTFGILDPIPSGASMKTYLSFEGLRGPFREKLRNRAALRRQKALESDRLVDQAIAIEQEDEDLAAEMQGANLGPHVSFADDDAFAGGDFEDDDSGIPSFPNLDDEDDMFGDVNEAFDSGRIFREKVEKIASAYGKVCAEHLLKTEKLWELQAGDKDLEKRVDLWKDRMKPLLAEEELRPAFDITAYGQSVVNRFEVTENSTRITERGMKRLFQAQEKFEVCRLFLATLQLANTYTVEIVQSNADGVSEPSVKLITPSVTGPDKSRTPPSSKRSRQPGLTPKSARSPPLRSRIRF